MKGKCYCGSGFSYFLCCYRSKQCSVSYRAKSAKSFRGWVNGIISRQSECLFPGCQEKAINSHTISKSAALSFLSHNSQKRKDGSSVTLIIYPHSIRRKEGKKYLSHEESIAEASTDYLFCSEHDSRLFLLVDNPEKCPPAGKSDMFFMASYRSVCARMKKIKNMLAIHSSTEYLEYCLSDIQKDLHKREATEIFSDTIDQIEKIKIKQNFAIQGLERAKLAMEKHILYTASGVSVKNNRTVNIVLLSDYLPENAPFLMSTADLAIDRLGGIGCHSINSLIVDGKWMIVFTILSLEDGFGISASDTLINSLSSESYFEGISRTIIPQLFSEHENLAISKKWLDSLSDYDRETVRLLVESTGGGWSESDDCSSIMTSRGGLTDRCVNGYDIVGCQIPKQLLEWGLITRFQYFLYHIPFVSKLQRFGWKKP